MGLTVRQAEEIIQIIASQYQKFSSKRITEARNQQAAAAILWERDPRIEAFRVAVEAYSGGISCNDGYRNPKQWLYEQITSRWEEFESGTRTSPAFEALQDAGHVHLPMTKTISFQSLPEAGMLSIALRTTNKKWGDIAGPYSKLVVDTTASTSEEEVIDAVKAFLEALK